MTTTPAHPVMNFYGFTRMPFDKDFESADAFHSPSLADTVAMLGLGVESEDILLVAGPIGSGKSSGSEVLHRRARSESFLTDLPARPWSFRGRLGQGDSPRPSGGTTLQLREGSGPVFQVCRRAVPQARRRDRRRARHEGVGAPVRQEPRQLQLGLEIEDHLRPLRAARAQGDLTLFATGIGPSGHPSLGRVLRPFPQGHLRVYKPRRYIRRPADTDIFRYRHGGNP